MKLTPTQKSILKHLIKTGGCARKSGRKFTIRPILGTGDVRVATVQPLIDSGLLVKSVFSKHEHAYVAVETEEESKANLVLMIEDIVGLEEPKPITRDDIVKQRGGIGELIKGWFVNAHTMRITEGCSNGINHSSEGTDRTSTQGIGEMYRTREDAEMVLKIRMVSGLSTKLLRLADKG